MSRSIRVFWSPRKGVYRMNFNWRQINANSVVLVTASEYDPNAEPSKDTSDRRFLGDANIRVNNISPHGPPSDPNHGVEFMLEVDWHSPLPICTDITVLDDAPEEVFYTDGAPR